MKLDGAELAFPNLVCAAVLLDDRYIAPLYSFNHIKRQREPQDDSNCLVSVMFGSRLQHVAIMKA